MEQTLQIGIFGDSISKGIVLDCIHTAQPVQNIVWMQVARNPLKIPFRFEWQEMYNMKVLLLAQKLHVPVVDIRSAFLAQHGYQALLCEDGIHPNRKGHRFIYKTIMQQYHPCLQN